MHALEVTRVILRQREKVFDPVKPPTDLLEALLHARNEAIAKASEHIAAIFGNSLACSPFVFLKQKRRFIVSNYW